MGATRTSIDDRPRIPFPYVLSKRFRFTLNQDTVAAVSLTGLS